jgi:hypothetical protein
LPIARRSRYAQSTLDRSYLGTDGISVAATYCCVSHGGRHFPNVGRDISQRISKRAAPNDRTRPREFWRQRFTRRSLQTPKLLHGHHDRSRFAMAQNDHRRDGRTLLDLARVLLKIQ